MAILRGRFLRGGLSLIAGERSAVSSRSISSMGLSGKTSIADQETQTYSTLPLVKTPIETEIQAITIAYNGNTSIRGMIRLGGTAYYKIMQHYPRQFFCHPIHRGNIPPEWIGKLVFLDTTLLPTQIRMKGRFQWDQQQ